MGADTRAYRCKRRSGAGETITVEVGEATARREGVPGNAPRLQGYHTTSEK